VPSAVGMDRAYGVVPAICSSENTGSSCWPSAALASPAPLLCGSHLKRQQTPTGRALKLRPVYVVLPYIPLLLQLLQPHHQGHLRIQRGGNAEAVTSRIIKSCACAWCNATPCMQQFSKVYPLSNKVQALHTRLACSSAPLAALSSSSCTRHSSPALRADRSQSGTSWALGGRAQLLLWRAGFSPGTICVDRAEQAERGHASWQG
jgi:hypothetical protein